MSDMSHRIKLLASLLDDFQDLAIKSIEVRLVAVGGTTTVKLVMSQSGQRLVIYGTGVDADEALRKAIVEARGLLSSEDIDEQLPF